MEYRNKIKRFGKRLMAIGYWLINKERLGLYGFLVSFIISILSLLIGYWSFEASREALDISKKTSERDSITSILVDNNRKNDSTANRLNNFRDSIQQQDMVLLLEKYNTLADGLLQTQMNAGKPQFYPIIVSIEDTVLKNDFEGKYRLPIINLYFEKYFTRPAYNTSVEYRFYYPNSNKKYFVTTFLGEQVSESRLIAYIIPVIPCLDKEYFFIKLTIKWEDRILGNKKDSSIYTFLARTVASKTLFTSKIPIGPDRNLYDKVKNTAEFVNFSQSNMSKMIDVFYRQSIQNQRTEE